MTLLFEIYNIRKRSLNDFTDKIIFQSKIIKYTTFRYRQTINRRRRRLLERKTY